MKLNLVMVTLIAACGNLLLASVAMADDSVNCKIDVLNDRVTYDSQTNLVQEAMIADQGGVNARPNGLSYSLLGQNAALGNRAVQYAIKKLNVDPSDVQSAAIFQLQFSDSTMGEMSDREMVKLNGNNGELGAVIAFVPHIISIDVSGPACEQ